MRDEYQWEVGQEVIHVPSTAFRSRRSIKVVERVTPTGLARVGGTLYRPDGRERGGSGYYWNRIQPVTPELRAEVLAEVALSDAKTKAYRLIEQAQRGGGRHVTLEQWQGVIAALEGLADV